MAISKLKSKKLAKKKFHKILSAPYRKKRLSLVVFILLFIIIGAVIVWHSFASEYTGLWGGFSEQTNFGPSSTAAHNSLSADIKPLADGGPDGYFGAVNGYWHNSSDPFYMGLQSNSPLGGKTVIFSIWGAIAATSSGVAEPFGGEGTGYHTLMRYEWVPGHTYHFMMTKTSEDATTSVWTAYVTDTNSNVTTTIGSITINGNRGYLRELSVFFHERFSGQTNSCSDARLSGFQFSGTKYDSTAASTTGSIIKTNKACSDWTYSYSPTSGTLVSYGGLHYGGRLDAFATNSVGHLIHKVYTSDQWVDWEDLGGSLTSNPAVASMSSNRLDVFARDSNGYLMTKVWNGSAWGGWASFTDTKIFSDPAAVSWGSGRIDVVARSATNSVIHKVWNGTSWSGWEDLGGGILSSPAVASWGSNRLDIIVRGLNNHIYHKFWNGTSWSGWGEIPGAGQTIDSPAAVSMSSGRIDAFVRGTDNQLYTNFYVGNLPKSTGSWNKSWGSLGGVLYSAPGAASRDSGSIDVFVKGYDNAMWHRWYDNGWHGWESLGGTIASDPEAISWH